ncbi:MAG: peptide deformylase [Lentisphaerae bacterium]|nr:peptide deformylase [Lentisphaerota bacterium]
MRYNIVTYGDPVLRKKATPVLLIDDGIRQLAADMLETMRANRGLGLAAQQIGRTEAICVIDCTPVQDRNARGDALGFGVEMPLILINPSVLVVSGEQVDQEGCLSFPGVFAPVSRADETVVKYLDEFSQEKTITSKGLLSRAVQHEVDHLNGVLFIDRMSPEQRADLSETLKKLAKVHNA